MLNVKVKRDAPTKICLHCFAYQYSGNRICPDCGSAFYLSKKEKAEGAELVVLKNTDFPRFGYVIAKGE